MDKVSQEIDSMGWKYNVYQDIYSIIKNKYHNKVWYCQWWQDGLIWLEFVYYRTLWGVGVSTQN